MDFEEIDITDPTKAAEKEWMWEHGEVKEGQRRPMPPQIFNNEEYCGVGIKMCTSLVHCLLHRYFSVPGQVVYPMCYGAQLQP